MLLDRECVGATGLIVHAGGESISLLSTDGAVVVVPRESVSRVLVFNTLDNPIATLHLEGELGALAREVRLEGDQTPPFTGWPIRFQEDAIVFFDIDGKTHVEDIDRISSFRPARDLPERKEIPHGEAQRFVPGPDVAECPLEAQSGAAAIHPTRVISDQIKIGRFLAAFQAGFEELERFQRRSAYYARPFLYDSKTKLALQLSDFNYFRLQELPSQFPLYLQWGSGDPFRSQGFIELGSKPVEWLPNVEPVFAIRSDVKSSFFSASFVGNPVALAVGEGFIVRDRFSYDEFFSRLGTNDVLVVTHLNHLALTGLDWGHYSAAVGFYYPVFGVYANGLFREVVSPQASLIYRLLFIEEKARFRLLYSSTSLGSNHPGGDIEVVLADEMRNPSVISPESEAIQDSLQSYSLDSQFIRAGADFDLGHEAEAGIDLVRLTGSYRERFPDSRYELEYDHWIASFHVVRGFGNFVALRGHLNCFDRYYKSRGEGEPRSIRDRPISLTVALEFVL